MLLSCVGKRSLTRALTVARCVCERFASMGVWLNAAKWLTRLKPQRCTSCRGEQQMAPKTNDNTNKIQSLINELFSCWRRVANANANANVKSMTLLPTPSSTGIFFFIYFFRMYTCLHCGGEGGRYKQMCRPFQVFNSTIFPVLHFSCVGVLVSWSESSFGGEGGKEGRRGGGKEGGRAGIRRNPSFLYALLSSGFVWMLLSPCTLISIVSGLRDSFPFSSFSGSFLWGGAEGSET